MYFTYLMYLLIIIISLNLCKIAVNAVLDQACFFLGQGMLAFITRAKQLLHIEPCTGQSQCHSA